MHIVYVSREFPPSARSGGIGSYVWDIGRQLVTRGHQVTVVAATDDTRASDSTAVCEGITVRRLGGADFAVRGAEPAGNYAVSRYFRTLSRYRSYRERVARVLDGLIDEDRVDLVEFAEYGDEAAVWMHHPRRVPMVLRLHTPSTLDRSSGARIRAHPLSWIQYRRALAEYEPLRFANAITSCSRALAEWVQADAGLRGADIHVIPNPVEIADWICKAPGEMPPSAADSTEIAFAGTVVPAKGVPELIEACSLLRKDGWNISLNVAGRLGRYGLALAETSRAQPELASWLHLLGQQSRIQLGALYRKSSVVCFPSWWEAFGLVCIEAMASGAIVIGSRAGGMKEIIDHGVNGFLVEAHDVAGLASCISDVLQMSPVRLSEIRAAAQQQVRTRFDTDVVVPKMIEFYRRVLADFSPSRPV